MSEDREELRRQYRNGALRVIALLEDAAAGEAGPVGQKLQKIARDLRTALGAASALTGDEVADVIEHQRLTAALQQIAQSPDECGRIARRALGEP